MRVRVALSLLAAPALCAACLSLADDTSSSPGSDSGVGGSGGGVVDGSWPDGAGGTTSGGGGGVPSGGSAGASGGGGTSAGGTGGIGASGGVGGAGGTGATGATGGTSGTGGTSATGGTGGTGGTTSWNAYSYNLSSGAWSSPVPLSTVWSGANAPPSSGILCVAQLEHFDRLLVFASDGKYYLRADGLWQTPVSITSAFPGLAGMALKSLYHVASPPGTTPLTDDLTFVDNPKAVLYRYNANGSIVYVDSVTMTDEPAPGAPQGTGTALWSFEIRDPSKYGAADYIHLYTAYSNGKLYQFDAAFVWKSWTITQSPFWLGKTGAPATSGLQAAWTDAKLGRVWVVGP